MQSGGVLEVELKFGVPDHAAIRSRLETLGGVFSPVQTQIDLYFAHPSRNFVQTDEAVRIRSVDDDNILTYKGPKLDRTTKTRREIEAPTGPGAKNREQLIAWLTAVGFTAVREVRKTREPGELIRAGRTVHLALDTVAELGTFLEVELLVQPADLDAARSVLNELAAELALGPPELRGYLDLLMNRPR